MRNLFQLITFVSFSLIHSQIIHGKVETENGVGISGVNIYVDGTKIFTESTSDGSFQIDINGQKTGNLIFQKEYYETVVAGISQILGKKVTVKMMRFQEIEEVEIIPFTDEAYRKYINYFLETFIGMDLQNVRIRNQNTLKFSYDKNRKILRVRAPKTLRIENKKLGYDISYNLMNYESDLENHTVSYSGTSFFTETSAKQEIKVNRMNAYYGSLMHFLRSIYRQNPDEEGFIVNYVRKIPNPKYPTDEELLKLKEYWQINKSNRNINVPPEISDISARKRGNKYILALTKSKLNVSEYTQSKNGAILLSVPDILQVNYQLRPYEIKKRNPVQSAIPIHQSSMIFVEGNIFEIYSDGNTSDPELLLVDGDFGKNKISTMLPLDYQPGD